MADAPVPGPDQSFTAKEFRSALGAFATGVTVITSQGGDSPYGMTANAFSSLSLDPPLILVCVKGGTDGCKTIEENRVFAVNVLGADQEPISRYFSSKDRPRGRDAFREISHRSGASGSPILDGVAAYIDCRVTAQHPAGDHVIFIGEVQALAVDPSVPPLLFHHGKYRHVRED
jgi:flavin reductase (DIM6/NTAB) family NADH-FMN oxidoreductase RutF